ncbi:MAG TPA: YdgA family protein [Enterobacteriaceae bacterium]|nr:YdgA family protein [Enterobacteriaceae bacterium]
MKKSLVAVGVVAALGVVWTAGAWFTGKQMETRFADMIEQANANLKRTAPEAGLKLSYENYQRGVFSSRLQLVIEPTGRKGSPWLKPGQRVVFNEHVDHGPFPLAQLKTFNLLPAMASISSTLVNNELSKPLFDAAKGKSPFSAETRVGYSAATDTLITLIPINYAAEGEKVAFSGGTIQLKADREGKDVTLNAEMKSGLIEALNEYNQHVQLSFGNLKLDGTSEMTDFSERIGRQQLSLSKLSVAIEGQQMALLDEMSLDGSSTLTDDRKSINTRLDYAINGLNLQNQDIGSGKLSLKIDKLDGAAWHEFNQRYEAWMASMAAQGEHYQDPGYFQNQMADAVIGILPVLLKGGPSVTIAPLSWKNAKGETTFNLALQLGDPAAASDKAKSMDQLLDRTVKSLDSKLVIPVPMATHLMTQTAQLEGYQPDEAAKLATAKVEGFSALGHSFGFTTREKENIVASFQYGNGKVTLNGKSMTPEEFAMMFIKAMPQDNAQPAPFLPSR